MNEGMDPKKLVLYFQLMMEANPDTETLYLFVQKMMENIKNMT
jgi:hypothetical protein